MFNKDLLKQLIIEEKKKKKMNLVEAAPVAPAPAPTAVAPAPAGKPVAAAPAGTINMADPDIVAAVSGWAQLLKNSKSPAFAKLKPFFDANKVKTI